MREIDTPLGTVGFSIDAECSSEDRQALGDCIQIYAYRSVLPEGMSVSACFVAVADITPMSNLRNIVFSACLTPSVKYESGPETGEALDAMGFYSNQHVMLIGTEDTDFLMYRLGSFVKFPESPYPFTNKSISIHLLETAAGENLTLHFLIAWNKVPEDRECSCWVAVDQNHSAIMEFLKANKAVHPSADAPAD